MHAGGGSYGPERERHVGSGDGYVIIEKIEKPEFKFTYFGAPQYYTIPKTAVYTFAAVGAKGGNCGGCKKDTCDIYEYELSSTKLNWCHKCAAQYNEGGYGALAKGKFLLRKGDKVEIIVGGKGQDCKTLPRYSITKIPDGVDRDYLEARTGAGGGGASSVRVKSDADGRENLLLIAGGGGGSGFFFNGEDGEGGPDGGFDWGGSNGGGGGLGENAEHGTQFGGAGGGGVHGNGDSRYAVFSGGLIFVKKENYLAEVWAEGGFSLSNGSGGGFVDKDETYQTDNDYSQAQSGSAGGYGGGGQGGAGE